MKKLLSLFTIIAIIFGIFGVYAEEKSDNSHDKPNCAEEFVRCDFDHTMPLHDNADTVYDEVYGKVAEVSSSLKFNLNRKINTGKTVISFKIKSGKNTIQQLKTYSLKDKGGAMFENLIFNSNGYLYLAQKNKWGLSNTPRAEYKLNQWYKVDLGYDFDKRIIEAYFDDNYLGQTDMADNLTEISSFAFLSVDGGTYIDEVETIYIPTDGIVDIGNFPYINNYASEYANAIQPWIETEKTGDAYFGKTIDFKLKLIENTGEPFSGFVSVNLWSAAGIRNTTKRKTELNGYGKSELLFELEADDFGTEEIEVYIEDDDGNVLGTSSKEISVMPLGKFNSKIGFADHLYRGRGSEQYDLMKFAGIGAYRDGIDTTDLVKTDGTIGNTNPASIKQLERMYKESQVRHLFTLGTVGYWDSKEPGKAFKMPINKSQIDKWLTYVDEALAETERIKLIDYEIGNELNYAIQSEPNVYNAEQYYNLCKEVYIKIKSKRPDARVFTIVSGSTTNTEQYIEDLLKMGIGEYSDGFSLHPYDVFKSPETEETLKRTAGLHDLLEKYGQAEKPVVYSEYGWTVSKTTGVTDEQKNRYVAQSAVLLSEKAENIEYYNLLKKLTYSDFEDNFGFLENNCSKVPYKPTKAFMVLAAYNNIMAGTENLTFVDTKNKDMTVCVLDNDNGKKTVMAWVKKDKPDVNAALNIGCETARIYDLYGNESVVKTNNGVINFSLGQNPVYIVGDIENVSEASASFGIDVSEISIADNDISYITGRIADENCEIETICPNNITSEEATFDSDGKFSIKVTSGTKERANEKIRLRVKKNNDVVYETAISVNYRKSVDVIPTIVYYRDSYWQLKLKVTNLTNSIPIGGRVCLTGPSGFNVSEKSLRFENISANESRYFYICIPPQYTSKRFDVSGFVELYTGEKADFDVTSYFVGLMYNSKKPQIDGKISQSEYNSTAPVRLDAKMNTVMRLAEYSGLDETSGMIYLNYDEKNLYLAAKIYDSTEGATGAANRVWQNDSIQFAFAETADVNAPRTEYAIGKDNMGNPTIQRYAFIGTQTVAAGGSGDEVKMGDDKELTIEREGVYTIYELKLPWTEIFGKERPLFERRDILFSALINDNDGLGRTGYVEFCPGIGGVKNPAEFSKIPAMK